MPPVNNIKLDSITSEYSSFVDNQVLTAKQLNDIIEFFEDQQRLTRTCLIGVGTVCGFGFKGDEKGITVGKGCGVTTDGDLFYLQDTTFADFRVYDNSLVKYPPFYPLGNDKPQMPLWELVAPDANTKKLPADSMALTNFKAKTGKTVQQMVGLLYLEYYLKDPDACTAIDCDNQGKKQVAKLKVLLLDPSDMDLVINRSAGEAIADDIFRDYFNTYTKFLDLDIPGARRVLLNAKTTASQSGLSDAYVSTVNNGAAALVNAIGGLYKTFGFILDKNNKYNIQTEINKLNAVLAQKISTQRAQYFYDFYKDIVTAYNELRCSLVDLIYICCPDIYSFPKHLMLGYLNQQQENKPTPYRHRFYPSPAVTENKTKVAAAISLMERMFLLMNNFSVPAAGNPVKITPSADYDKLIENRAIPFYYAKPSTIVAKWNYNRWLQGTHKHTLSYHASDYAGGNDMVVTPLGYSIDVNDFFRIEGHIGRPYSEALKLVDEIRKGYNLPFDIVAIRMGEVDLSDIDIDDYSCQFGDLEAILNAFKTEQNCLYSAVAKFFSNFDTRTADSFVKTDYKKYSRKSVKEFLDVAGKGIPNEEASIKAGPQQFSEPEVLFNQAAKTQYMLYSGTGAVDNNLHTGEYALGYYYDLIRKEAKAKTISDYAEAAESYIDTSKLDDDDAAIAVDIPLRMLAGTRNISEWLPDRIVDIDEDTLSNFSTRLDELCAEVKAAMSRSRKIFAKQTYKVKGYEQDYELRLWQLLENCCAGEAMEVILKEIMQRKENLLKQLTFAAYATSHPGLEHKAGVSRGGTFVMVYASTPKAKPKKPSGGAGPKGRFDFMDESPEFVKSFTKDEDFIAYVAERIDPDDAADALAYYMKKSGRTYTPTKQKKIIEEIIKISKEKKATPADPVGNNSVPTNIVFADFCLPYICCSDCPPVAFITPEPKIALSLPKNTACSDEVQLQFSVTPSDGVVKAATGFEDTVVLSGNQYFFDPSKVKDGFFGKTIQFTLNDQPTSCVISVVKHPEILTISSAVSVKSATAVSIAFSATTNQVSGDTFVYSWDSGDGRVFKDLSVPDQVVVFQYDDMRKSHPDGKLHATLKVSNQGCDNTRGLDFTIDIPPALVLSAGEVCAGNGPVEFITVKPDGAVVSKTSDPARIKFVGNKWFFDPASGPYEVIINDFTVNGIPVPECQIRVHELPNPSFSATVNQVPATGKVELTCTNTTPNAGSFNYSWNVDGEVSTGTNATKSFSMTSIPAQGRSIQVILTARNKADNGCQKIKTETVHLPGIQTSLALKKTQACSGGGLVEFITVAPTNGVVSKLSNPQSVKLVGGKWMFDPSSGPFGVLINDFTVNGVAVPACQIRINEQPQPSFTPTISSNPAKKEVTVICTNTTPNIGNFSYNWNIDGETSSSTNAQRTFNMADVQQGRDIQVTLLAKNKTDADCQQSILPVIVHLPGIAVSLKFGVAEVCSGAGVVEFIDISPASGTVSKKTNPEQVIFKNNKWFFNPLDGPFEVPVNDFTVNGISAPDCSIVIHEKPRTSFNVNINKDPFSNSVILICENTTPNIDAFVYVWTIDGKQVSKETHLKANFDMSKDPQGKNIVVGLLAANKADKKCSTGFTSEPPVHLPGPQEKIVDTPDLNIISGRRGTLKNTKGETPNDNVDTNKINKTSGKKEKGKE